MAKKKYDPEYYFNDVKDAFEFEGEKLTIRPDVLAGLESVLSTHLDTMHIAPSKENVTACLFFVVNAIRDKLKRDNESK